MQRIIIIGPCGAGKSTLSTMLAAKLGLPLYHMDKLNWQPGWIESSKDDIRERLKSILSTDRWMIDGNYSGTLAERINHADTIIYLDFPIRLCLWRVMKRVWHYRGRTRPDMTEDCPERFDFAFMLYLMQWNIGSRPKTEALVHGHEAKTVRLRNPAELDRWLAVLPDAG